MEITSASEVPPLEVGYYFITSTSRKVWTVSEDLTRFQRESDIGNPADAADQAVGLLSRLKFDSAASQNRALIKLKTGDSVFQ